MQDISALTIPQLKAELTKLEVPFKSKMHKDELALLLENALIKAAQVTTPTSEPAQTEWPATLVSEEVAAWDEVGLSKPARTVVHMPNSERVQKYARANNRWSGWHGDNGLITVKLTPKQMRRVRKNANKHGEGFSYSALPKYYRSPMGGYSLLARTPEGMGIFHQFSY